MAKAPEDVALDWMARPNMPARQGTARVVRSVQGAQHAVVLILFEDSDGVSQSWSVSLGREPDGGWSVFAGGGGASHVEHSDRLPLEFLFNVGGFPDWFYGSGPVVGRGCEDITDARFTFADRHVENDELTDGHALVLIDHPVLMPVVVELLDAQAAVRWSQTVTGRLTKGPPETP